MERYIDNFPSLLSGVDLKTLEDNPQSAYALSDQLQLIYVNPAWYRFAQDNNGEPDITERFPVGSDFSTCIDGPLKGYYIEQFRHLLQTGVVWEHDYECSSPELFRLYHEIAYRMHNKRGIVVTNSLVIEKTHSPPDGPEAPLEKMYRHANGLITQCAYCRRFQRDKESEVWDWSPEWVRHAPERVSHSLCEICFDYYFKHHESAPHRV